jgi:hypothetical protein
MTQVWANCHTPKPRSSVPHPRLSALAEARVACLALMLG